MKTLDFNLLNSEKKNTFIFYYEKDTVEANLTVIPSEEDINPDTGLILQGGLCGMVAAAAGTEAIYEVIENQKVTPTPVTERVQNMQKALLKYT